MALSFKTNQSLQRLQQIILLLKESPKTSRQITEIMNLHEDICRSYMRYLLKEKQVYIKDFVVEKHTWSRVYALGNEPSVSMEDYKNTLREEQIRKRAERDKIRFARMTELGLRRVKERKPRAPRKEKRYVVGKSKKITSDNFVDITRAWYAKSV